MFWVMTTIIVSSFSGMVADAVVPVDDTEFYGEVIFTASETYSFEPAGEDQGESFFDKYQRRWKIQNTIESSLSPTQNLEQLAGAVLGKDDLSMLSSDSPQSEMGMYEIVLGKLSNIVAMFVWVIVSLAATYIVFMRQDIR
jgi:ABC-2 type transport system permease protein